MSSKEFCNLIDRIYNPSKVVYAYLNVTPEYAEFFEDKEKTTLLLTLRFIQPGERPQPAKRTFHTVQELRKFHNPPELPLKGVRIALDPGHIGGKWASLEERSVIWNNNPVIREGDKNIQVAKLIRTRLKAAGAQVYLTHDKPDPLTDTRPKDFMDEARELVYQKKGITEDSPKAARDACRKLITWYAELFFYRRAEIAQRAENLRNEFPSDINISNHFNATERSGSGEIVKDNRHVFLLNGCYGPDEMDNPVTRFYMFSKLLEQSLNIEMAAGDAITAHLLKVASLPPAKYGREKYQCRVNQNPYLYARNLAASRQYPGPTLILEPFYMNNAWTAARLSAGDYDGVRPIAGGMYRSLLREYADAVADALIEVYGKWTVDKKSPKSKD